MRWDGAGLLHRWKSGRDQIVIMSDVICIAVWTFLAVVMTPIMGVCFILNCLFGMVFLYVHTGERVLSFSRFFVKYAHKNHYIRQHCGYKPSLLSTWWTSSLFDVITSLVSIEYGVYGCESWRHTHNISLRSKLAWRHFEIYRLGEVTSSVA
jgi:hypothetical protein